MAKGEIIEIGKILNEIFRNRRIKLNKVVLFGSFANNTERDTSDIDIIIVSEDFRNRDLSERCDMVSGVNRELVQKTKKPVDTLFYSDEEWEEGYSLIINAAKNSGVVIYG
jgi:predicted nucleotidyltransferase